MPTSPFSASTSCSQGPKLKYDASKVGSLNMQFAEAEGGLTDLRLPLLDMHGLSAEEGIQVLQDCILTAAHRTYQQAKAAPAQPRHKPWFDSECRAALHSYAEAKQDPSSHVAKVFLKRFKTIVRRKKRLFTRHTAAKLADLAKDSQPSSGSASD
ncbi:hypothetical protein ABBQ32_000892 [Trebouxia sp. C0010 RCD-2024]